MLFNGVYKRMEVKPMSENRLIPGDDESLKVLNLLEQLKKLLIYEREQIINLNAKELPDLMLKKEKLINTLSSKLPEFFSKIGDKERQSLELLLREMLHINRGNVYLMHNYRQYQEKIAELIGLDIKGKEMPHYKSRGRNGKNLKSAFLFDGRA